jgi:SPP1 family predicted phage head-tail adaptor
MRAGELRERITLQSNTSTRDGFGAEVPHWSTVATVWAKVVATSGNEQIATGASVVTTIYTITLRERDDIDQSMRVLYDGLPLDIKAIVGGEDTGEMVLDCRQSSRGA